MTASRMPRKAAPWSPRKALRRQSRIGSATLNILIGPIAGASAGGHGIVINGSILGDGAYKDVQGNGLRIGGLGGNVSVAGGMTVNGPALASSNGANATAVRLGSGATVPTIKNVGSITATGGSGGIPLRCVLL